MTSHARHRPRAGFKPGLQGSHRIYANSMLIHATSLRPRSAMQIVIELERGSPSFAAGSEDRRCNSSHNEK